MSVSTDAYLVFGIDLGAEDDWEDDHLKALTALADDLGLKDERAELVDHCHHEYRMWIVAVKGAFYRAPRGTPKAIEPPMLTVPADRIDALRSFCAEHGIEWKEPQWLLCSMWS